MPQREHFELRVERYERHGHVVDTARRLFVQVACRALEEVAHRRKPDVRVERRMQAMQRQVDAQRLPREARNGGVHEAVESEALRDAVVVEADLGARRGRVVAVVRVCVCGGASIAR
eukprot:365597-Chlamydomonas_euryale.AAC.6